MCACAGIASELGMDAACLILVRLLLLTLMLMPLLPRMLRRVLIEPLENETVKEKKEKMKIMIALMNSQSSIVGQGGGDGNRPKTAECPSSTTTHPSAGAPPDSLLLSPP